MLVFFLVGFFLTNDLVFTIVFFGATSAGSGATSAGSGATSTSGCSEKNAELSADNGFVSVFGFGLVSVNAGFSSCSDPLRYGISPKSSDVTLLLSVLM